MLAGFMIVSAIAVVVQAVSNAIVEVRHGLDPFVQLSNPCA